MFHFLTPSSRALGAALVPACCAILIVSSGCGKQDKPSVLTGKPSPVAQTPEPSGRVTDSLVDFAPMPGPSPAPVTVNGVSMSRIELDARVNQALSSPQYARVSSQFRGQLVSQLEKSLTDEFVMQQLLRDEADRQGIVAAESNITAAIERANQSLPPNVTLEQALQQVRGTMDSLRQQVADNLRMNALVNAKLTPLTDVSDEEMAEFYAANRKEFETGETVNARHILVKCEPTADAATKLEKRKLAESYREQLLGGADFAEFAKKHSEGPSGPAGGSLGTFSRERMVKPFADAAFSQEVDAIGEVVETQFGYHIVQVVERNEAVTKSLDEAREELSERLNGKRRKAALDAYISELKGNAEITYAE